MHPLFRSILAACVTAAATLPCAAHEYYARDFVLVHPWGDPSEPEATSAAIYFTIQEVAGQDRLLKVSTPLAEKVEFRADDDAARPPLKFIAVGPTRTQFTPGKPHLLLKGLRRPLEWKQSYEMTMTFEKAGPMRVMVSVGAH